MQEQRIPLVTVDRPDSAGFSNNRGFVERIRAPLSCCQHRTRLWHPMPVIAL